MAIRGIQHYFLASSLAVRSSSNVVLKLFVGTMIFVLPLFFFPPAVMPAWGVSVPLSFLAKRALARGWAFGNAPCPNGNPLGFGFEVKVEFVVRGDRAGILAFLVGLSLIHI